MVDWWKISNTFHLELTFSLSSSKSTFSEPSKCICKVMRTGSIIIFQMSKLWEAKFSILCDVIFPVKLQGKFEIDHSSWEWKRWRKFRTDVYHRSEITLRATSLPFGEAWTHLECAQNISKSYVTNLSAVTPGLETPTKLSWNKKRVVTSVMGRWLSKEDVTSIQEVSSSGYTVRIWPSQRDWQHDW